LRQETTLRESLAPTRFDASPESARHFLSQPALPVSPSSLQCLSTTLPTPTSESCRLPLRGAPSAIPLLLLREEAPEAHEIPRSLQAVQPLAVRMISSARKLLKHRSGLLKPPQDTTVSRLELRRNLLCSSARPPQTVLTPQMGLVLMARPTETEPLERVE
jgi:hypothetical protein